MNEIVTNSGISGEITVESGSDLHKALNNAFLTGDMLSVETEYYNGFISVVGSRSFTNGIRGITSFSLRSVP